MAFGNATATLKVFAEEAASTESQTPAEKAAAKAAKAAKALRKCVASASSISPLPLPSSPCDRLVQRLTLRTTAARPVLTAQELPGQPPAVPLVRTLLPPSRRQTSPVDSSDWLTESVQTFPFPARPAPSLRWTVAAVIGLFILANLARIASQYYRRERALKQAKAHNEKTEFAAAAAAKPNVASRTVNTVLTATNKAFSWRECTIAIWWNVTAGEIFWSVMYTFVVLLLGLIYSAYAFDGSPLVSRNRI